jgi:Acetyltransferase (GNAT) domain
VLPAFKRIDIDAVDWKTLDAFPDRNIHQTRPWLEFISRTHKVEPVMAELRDGGAMVGLFSGMLTRVCGVKILGSPFPGWSTTYMGFNLSPEVPRRVAVEALEKFAFRELRCVHLELMDRHLTLEDVTHLDFDHRMFEGYEVDLTQSEIQLSANMKRQCRQCIKKAAKSGVVIEEAHDPEFADDYFAQLKHVFALQNLVPPYGVDRIRELIRNVHPTGHLLLLRARDKDGRCIATGLFPAMNGTAYAWGLANWRQHSNVRPVEALVWHAMRYWKERGMKIFDFLGGGDYKKKYGAHEISVPWIRKSRNRAINVSRRIARPLFDARQRVLGQLNNLKNHVLKRHAGGLGNP